MMIIPQLTIQYETYPLNDSFVKDWEKIAESAPAANVFSSLIWQETGFSHFAPGKETLIPIRFLNDKGQTVAMVLMRETKRKSFGFTVKTWRTVDFNSMRIPVILGIDIPCIAGALKILYKEAGDFVDEFKFYKLDPLNDGLDEIIKALCECGISVEHEIFNIQPQLILPDDWNDYYYSHKKTFWKTIRYMKNKLGRDYGEVFFKRIRTLDDWHNTDLNKIINDIFSVYSNSWQNTQREESSILSFKQITSFYRDLITKLAYKGVLDLNIMCAGDKICAFDLNIIEGKTIIALFGTYNQEFQQYSPGKVLLANWLKNSHLQGDKLIEFGGDYLEYKRLWTNFETTSRYISFPGKTKLAKVKLLLRRLNKLLKSK